MNKVKTFPPCCRNDLATVPEGACAEGQRPSGTVRFSGLRLWKCASGTVNLCHPRHGGCFFPPNPARWLFFFFAVTVVPDSSPLLQPSAWWDGSVGRGRAGSAHLLEIVRRRFLFLGLRPGRAPGGVSSRSSGPSRGDSGLIPSV